MSHLGIVPDHRRVCEVTAAWALRRPWCGLAAIEVGVFEGQADVVAVSDPRRVPTCPEHATRAAAEAVVCRELYTQGLQDEDWGNDRTWKEQINRIRVRQRDARTVPALLAPRNTEPEPRVVIIECKRTRSDLLADLRAGKMLKYEDSATHCYLAATDQALGIRRGESPHTRSFQSRATADLSERGLPRSWGILRVDSKCRSFHAVSAWRTARRIRPTTPALVHGMAWRLAVSLSHRALG